MAVPKTPKLGLNKIDRSAPTTTTFNLKTYVDDNMDAIDNAVGAPNGLASLGADGTIPDTQIPASVTRDTELAAHAGSTTSVHGATSAATADALMQRDVNGRAKVAAPAASDDIARKAEVDAIRSDGTKSFVVEIRTTDSAAPVVGQMWFRSDLS